MKSAQKFALSLLISVVIFAGAVVVAFGGVFMLIEARFYRPAVCSRFQDKADRIGESLEQFVDANTERFLKYLNEPDVRSYLDRSQSEAQAESAGKKTGTLFTQVQGLKGIRIIGYDNTRRAGNQNEIHYSTFEGDIRSRGREILYYTYDSLAEVIPFARLMAKAAEGPTAAKAKIILEADPEGNSERMIFCLPMYDKNLQYRATAVFYLDTISFNNFLLERDLISIGEHPFVAEERGIVFGLPFVGRKGVLAAAGDRWLSDYEGVQILGSSDTAEWALFTSEKPDFPKVGLVCDRAVLSLTTPIKILLLYCFFFTEFLLIFMVLSLRPDDMTIIKERIRRTQLAVVSEIIERKDKDAQTWQQVAKNISSRKDSLSAEIARRLGRRGRRHKDELAALLDRSWSEIISAFTGEAPALALGADASELKRLLEEVISTATVKVAPQPAGAAAPASPMPAPPPARPAAPVMAEASSGGEELEEVEEVGAADEVEELDEVEEAESADEVEELDEIEEAEPADEIEELDEVEEAESADEVEELDEVEEAESADEVEELDEIEEAETADEVDELDEAESADGVEELGEVEEAESSGEVEELDEAEATEPADDSLGEAEGAESSAEPEEIEGSEPSEEAEGTGEADEAESTDGVEVPDEAEEAESDEVESSDEPAEAEASDEAEEKEPADESSELGEAQSADENAELGGQEEPESAGEADEIDEGEIEDGAPDEGEALAEESGESEDAGNAEEEVSVDEFLSSEEAPSEGKPVADDQEFFAYSDGFAAAPDEFGHEGSESGGAEGASEGVEVAQVEVSRPDDALFDEVIGFGEPSRVPQEDSDFCLEPPLSFGLPDYSFLDNELDDGDEIERPAAAQAEDDDDATLEPLGSWDEQEKFSFTPFGGEGGSLKELERTDEVILSSPDGTFKISDSVDSSGIKVDAEFSLLVRAVTKRKRRG